MAKPHDHEREGDTPAHGHDCGNLFGCGDEKGTGVVREDIKDAAFTKQAADHLLHMDEMSQGRLGAYLIARVVSLRLLLRASSFMGALAAIGPWFTKLARAADSNDASMSAAPDWLTSGDKKKEDEGHVHVVESNDQTVHLGVYDTTLPPILKTIPATPSLSPTRGRTS